MGQRYVSRELTHFVGRERSSDDERYSLLVNCILKPRELKASILRSRNSDRQISLSVRSNKKFSDGDMYVRNYVCFCDIPLGDMGIHMVKYSDFGLSFDKSFLIKNGASPVLYIANKSIVRHFDTGKDLSRSDYFDDHVRKYNKLTGKILSKRDELDQTEDSELVKLLSEAMEIVNFLDTMIFGFCKPVDEIENESHGENYYMEREWRIIDKLKFELSDICMVILPEAYIDQFNKDLPAYKGTICESEKA